jgi:hypothetical protein
MKTASGTLLCLMLVGCGFIPSESKLVGTWQVDLPPPQKMVFDFRKDHSYTMAITGQAGAMQGTWRLDGNLLTTTMGSFSVQGITTALSVPKGLTNQKYAIERLTGSSMVWRYGVLGSTLKLSRVISGPSAGRLPP